MVRRIGFVGGGNMGFALAKTITDRFPGVTIYVCVVSRDRLTMFDRELPGVLTVEGPCELAEASEVVFLSVKPKKIQANANFRKSKNLKELQKEYAKVQIGIWKLFEKELSEEFPEELKQKAEKLGEFAEKLKELNDEEKRINMSDEDAPVMRHKDGRSVPSYTQQSATDSKYGVVCAAQSTQNNDLPEDLLQIVDENTKPRFLFF